MKKSYTNLSTRGSLVPCTYFSFRAFLVGYSIEQVVGEGSCGLLMEKRGGPTSGDGQGLSKSDDGGRSWARVV